MNKFKKIFALLIVAVFTLTAFPVFSTCEATVKGNTDENVIEFLTAMKFMSNDSQKNFGGDRFFTRSEFAVMICNILDIVPDAMNESISVCTDVTGKNTSANYIKAVLDNGYMTLDDNGRFWPNETVTLEDASYSFVVLAGGKFHLKSMTAVNVATRMKLYSVNKIPAGKLTKGQVATLLYDTLHAPYYEQISYGNRQTFGKNTNYLVLEAVCNIVYGNGVVNGVNRSTLTRTDTNLRDGHIMIGDVYYSGENLDKYFGYAVKYYYSSTEKKESVRKLLFLQKDNSKNEKLEINADSIERVLSGNIEYYPDKNASKTKRVKIDGNTDVILNGVAYPSWTDEDLKPEFGKVILINNDGDSNYDVAFVESYTFMVVGYLDNIEEKIYDRYNGECLDLSEDGVMYKVYREEGTEVTLSRGVRIGTLIAVRESRVTNGIKNVYIHCGKAEVAGEVKGISGDYITLNDASVKISDTTTGSIAKNELSIGKTIAVYLWDDKIVRIEEPDTDSNFPNIGYLVDVDEKNEAFSKTLIFRWCNQNATFEDLEGAAKIILDGRIYKDSEMDILRQKLNESAQRSNYIAEYPYAQPVQIYKNTDGKVYKIDTADYDSAKEDATLTLKRDVAKTNAVYANVNKSFYSGSNLVCSTTSKTTYFNIPSVRNDENWYAMGKGISGVQNAGSYVIEPFFVQDNYEASVVFLYFTPYIPISGSALPGIITDITKVVDEEGEVVDKLTYYDVSGNEKTLTLPQNGISVPELNIGDVIRWRTNHGGEVVGIERTFSPTAIPGEESRINTIYVGNEQDVGSRQRGYAGIFGTVLSVKNNLITHTTSIAEDTLGVSEKRNLDNYLSTNNTRYFRYGKNARGAFVTPIIANQLVPYSMNENGASQVYMFIAGGSLRFVYEIESDI